MIKKIARPKVNLFLHVTGKREDGYHLLESLVIFPDGGDELVVRKSGELTLSVSGPFADDIGDVSDNLVLKAARLLHERMDDTPGAEIELIKNLPVASGIGGGSADAAAALLLLSDLWKCSLTREELQETGLSLGADVPACLLAKPLVMSGIGETLSELDSFPYFYILLVNSRTGVSTPEVFRNLTIPLDAPAHQTYKFATLGELIEMLTSSRNDLRPAALKLAPEIAAVLSRIEKQADCRFAQMSGSGATCFGIFETKADVDRAVLEITREHPEWWVQAMPV